MSQRLFVSEVFLGLRPGGETKADAAVGARAPSFSLRSAPGAKFRKTFDMADHLGKRPVVILFFATWSRPSALELPVLQTAHEKFGSRRLTVVGVSLDGPETAARVGPFTRRLGVSFPIGIDADSRVSNKLNPRRFAPFLILVGKDGMISQEKEGWTPKDKEALAASIEALVKD